MSGWAKMTKFVGAIDQGTTSTRFMIFDREGKVIAAAQKEHTQIYPKPGWVEHDAEEIWRNTKTVISLALEKAGLKPSDLRAIGVTNQRETTLLWSAARANRCIMRWFGKTLASINWSPRFPVGTARTASEAKRDCRLPAISARSSFDGCLTGMKDYVPKPNLVTHCSAPSIAGSCGT